MDHNVCRLQAGPVRLCHLALLPAEYFQLTLRGPATTVTRTIHYTATTFISNFLMVVYHSSEIPWNIYHLNLNSTAPRHGGKLFMTDVIIILTWRALPESGGEGTILSLLQDCRTAVTAGRGMDNSVMTDHPVWSRCHTEVNSDSIHTTRTDPPSSVSNKNSSNSAKT